ncbi:MAG: hypothetical protein ACKPKO_41805, partial [Candidatus Fonsibacter sp.]
MHLSCYSLVLNKCRLHGWRRLECVQRQRRRTAAGRERVCFKAESNLAPLELNRCINYMMKFSDHNIYMHRILHQRNSFNNYHRMIG